MAGATFEFMNDQARSELERERLKARDQRELELLRATNTFEHAAIRPLVLLNGGAIVAVLTFVGHIMGEETAYRYLDRQAIKFAFILWALGLVAAYAATTLGYFSQHGFLNEAQATRRSIEADLRDDTETRDKASSSAGQFGKDGDRYRNYAYTAGILSVLSFLCGVAFAARALQF
jgi:hypothetical protein